jgi:uncharacterized protein
MTATKPAILLVLLIFGTTAYAADFATFERDVEVPMRDGVILRADVYRPNAAGRFPVLVERTPYDKGRDSAFGLKAAARGYVVIIEDVRGRFASDGDWYPFVNEQNDGYDTIEWAAAQPFANGKIGMFGGSYNGATQMLAAIAHPPHLAGLFPYVTASNYHESCIYQGGALQQWFSETWASGLVRETVRRALVKADIFDSSRLPPERFSVFSLTPQESSTAAVAPYFLEWLRHPAYDEFWKRIAIDDHYADITVPALHVAGWYDIFLGGSLRNYMGIKLHGGTSAARNGQQLLVTVGGHAGDGPKVGAMDFGPGAVFDEDETTMRWYDYLFKGEKNEFSSGKPVKIFTLGRNQLRQEEDWPLARAVNARYYLHSNGSANSSGGTGSLSRAIPAQEKPDQYVYDPDDPVPTIGGPLCCRPLPTGIGPQDQSPAETRRDVLVYSTPVLARDVEVTGPITLDLYVSSSASDTDFTGMLVDVWPDGVAQNLTSGILRMRYRDSTEKPEPMHPAKTYHVTLDLWATSNVFQKGHRLRLEVSSSNFPRFDRSRNSAGDQESSVIRATNVVYHDRMHPSALFVPIVPD